MVLYTRFIRNKFFRFLYSFFVQTPLQIYWRFLTAYVPSSAAWVNYSGVSNEVLNEQWTLAQQGLISAPFPMTCSEGGTMHAAMPSALTIVPKHVTVVSVLDVPVADLASFDSNWKVGVDKDPSGVITMIAGLTYTTCHSFACCWRKPRVYAAASKIPVTLAYEFQNVIMSELGLDVSQR
jgi:hypothetical protein